MVQIAIDITKGLEENASLYFEKAKKAKKKLEGAKEALERAQAKLKDLVEKELKDEYDQEAIAAEKEAQAERAKPQWYEKFRWFMTSEGMLVVGGRDATSNEIVIKKHADKNDVVFHTDMAGSPFFVIKTKGETPSEACLNEVANAVFTFSRALKLGLSTANVFWVKPDQVTKQAQPGEFLPKGAFMIRGKTNYLFPSFDLAIGVTEEGRIMAGPKAGVTKHCEKVLVLEQADKVKVSDTAKKIKAELGGDLDTIIRALPSAGVRIKKERR